MCCRRIAYQPLCFNIPQLIVARSKSAILAVPKSQSPAFPEWLLGRSFRTGQQGDTTPLISSSPLRSPTATGGGRKEMAIRNPGPRRAGLATLRESPVNGAVRFGTLDDLVPTTVFFARSSEHQQGRWFVEPMVRPSSRRSPPAALTGLVLALSRARSESLRSMTTRRSCANRF